MSVPAVGVAPIVRPKHFKARGLYSLLAYLSAEVAAGLWRCCSRPSSVYGLDRWLSHIELTLYFKITALSSEKPFYTPVLKG